MLATGKTVAYYLLAFSRAVACLLPASGVRTVAHGHVSAATSCLARPACRSRRLVALARRVSVLLVASSASTATTAAAAAATPAAATPAAATPAAGAVTPGSMRMRIGWHMGGS